MGLSEGITIEQFLAYWLTAIVLFIICYFIWYGNLEGAVLFGNPERPLSLKIGAGIVMYFSISIMFLDFVSIYGVRYIKKRQR